MKKIFFVLSILIIGCNLKPKENLETENKQYETLKSNIFDYDELIYFKNNIENEKIRSISILKRKDMTQRDSIIFGLTFENNPISINDTSFIDKLETIGFSKKHISSDKFEEINKIYSDKIHPNFKESACIYEFKDILIFKKKSKIVGMSKVSFNCPAAQIQGAEILNEGFGQDGDLTKLREILN